VLLPFQNMFQILSVPRAVTRGQKVATFTWSSEYQLGHSLHSEIHKRWNRLVQEVIVVGSHLGLDLAELAEANLHTFLRPQVTDTLLRTCLPDRTSTACALYFKLYRRPSSMTLNCHTLLSSLTPTRTTPLTGKRMKGPRIFRFCRLISGNSIRLNSELFRERYPIQDSNMGEVQRKPRALKSGRFYGVLGPWSRSGSAVLERETSEQTPGQALLPRRQTVPGRCQILC